MELCKGGELFDQLIKLGGDHYSEVVCREIMKQLATGISYMHSKGIVHRDLNPDNILLLVDSSSKSQTLEFR